MKTNPFCLQSSTDWISDRCFALQSYCPFDNRNCIPVLIGFWSRFSMFAFRIQAFPYRANQSFELFFAFTDLGMHAARQMTC